MTPLELIEKGLVAGDLSVVADGYFKLTGKKVKTLQVVDTTREKMLAAIGDIRKICGSFAVSVADEVIVTEPMVIEKPAKKGKGGKPLPQAEVSDDTKYVMIPSQDEKPTFTATPWKNTFVDDKTIAPEEIAKSKKLAKKLKNKKKEYRDPFVPVDMNCAGCKKTFQVHPDAVPPVNRDDGVEDRSIWKCNDCAGRQ